MDSARIGRVIFIAGSTIALYVLVHKFVPLWWTSYPSKRRSSHSGSGIKDLTQSSAEPRSVELRQVAPPPGSKTATKIDIIAIHGFDTKSPDTWTWDPRGAKVNWLEDSRMLPTLVDARIFTCDWPADLLEQPDLVPKTIEEYARLLLAGIKSRRPVMGDARGMEDRPIVFIASCLGGVILMKALVMASQEYLSVKTATRGIVFLATPFRGTSFQDVARWAEPGLRAWARVRSKKVSNLLKHTGSTFDLGELVRSFTALCRETDLTDYIRAFYETGKSSLPRKLAPWLPASLAREMPVVDLLSATPDIVTHPLSLDRPHILMNKFSGPDDPQYKRVADTVGDLLRKIFDERYITKADIFMRNERYSLENLEIERLTGDSLPMDQCYINLKIMNSRAKASSQTEQADAHTKVSPFSLHARLKLGRPDEESAVTLPRLFEARRMHNREEETPRRILIRGQAGMGKTTLCKKIVYEFIYGTMWQDLFSYVFWVPLRNLKLQERRNLAGYNMLNLFHHEYFSQHREGQKLADALWKETNDSETLFILDGLDEVSGLDGAMFEFLETLLNQKNVIVTSRANTLLPANLKPLDLELETIGFGSKEVVAYIQNAFTNRETYERNQVKIDKVQDFLQHHQLLQDLVRIPIQLDAFCLTWDDTSSKHIPETMTAVYSAIERSLWKKDALNLGKGSTLHNIRSVRRVDHFIGKERELVEVLAFTGMINNIINFEAEHRDVISDSFGIPEQYTSVDDLLGKVSFLRTSDPTIGRHDKTYHFIHLTFQEYFAARYFVRRWKGSQPLRYLTFDDQVTKELELSIFLRDHKYDARFDILWRFVAGLLSADDSSQMFCFFKMIEEQPRDLLGPTHQRLIMRCLNEISPKTEPANFIEVRKDLEEKLSQWLLFECQFRNSSNLAREMDFPEASFRKALQQASNKTRKMILESFEYSYHSPRSVIELAASWIKRDSPIIFDVNDNGLYVRAALQVLRNQSTLSAELLLAVAGRLDDDDSGIREAAVQVLRNQSTLSAELLLAVAGRLDDDNWVVRKAAVQVLRNQSILSAELLLAVAGRLDDDDSGIREAALQVLRNQSILSAELLLAVAGRLDDDNSGVREAAVGLLCSITHSPIPDKAIEPFFKALLRLSFTEHTVWRLVNNTPCITRGLKDHYTYSWPKELTKGIVEVQNGLCEDLWKNQR